jgi:hypothetical protein
MVIGLGRTGSGHGDRASLYHYDVCLYARTGVQKCVKGACGLRSAH